FDQGNITNFKPRIERLARLYCYSPLPFSFLTHFLATCLYKPVERTSFLSTLTKVIFLRRFRSLTHIADRVAAIPVLYGYMPELLTNDDHQTIRKAFLDLIPIANEENWLLLMSSAATGAMANNKSPFTICLKENLALLLRHFDQHLSLASFENTNLLIVPILFLFQSIGKETKKSALFFFPVLMHYFRNIRE